MMRWERDAGASLSFWEKSYLYLLKLGLDFCGLSPYTRTQIKLYMYTIIQKRNKGVSFGGIRRKRLPYYVQDGIGKSMVDAAAASGAKEGMDMIKLENINKYFGELHVLKDVNLEVKEGEKLVIIGPSGSGKSTTVRCMNFLEEPSGGHVYIDGEELTHRNKTQLVRRTTSMVFQQFNLYPHMSVIKNLTLAPMKLHHKSRAEAEELAYHYLDVVGLREKAHVYPTTLSGGQQQRIAIARALCMQSKIILFDEPTSALDPETIQEVLDVMIKLAKENITMVVVTHEMGFARQVADRVVFMADGQILEEGTPDEFFENPQNERLKTFLGKIIRK